MPDTWIGGICDLLILIFVGVPTLAIITLILGKMWGMGYHLGKFRVEQKFREEDRKQSPNHRSSSNGENP